MTAQTLAAEGKAGRALVVLHRGSLSVAETGARLTPLLDGWIDAEDGIAGAMLFRAETVVPRYLLPESAIPAFAGSGL